MAAHHDAAADHAPHNRVVIVALVGLFSFSLRPSRSTAAPARGWAASDGRLGRATSLALLVDAAEDALILSITWRRRTTYKLHLLPLTHMPFKWKNLHGLARKRNQFMYEVGKGKEDSLL